MLASWKSLAALPVPLWRLAVATLVNRAGSMAFALMALWGTQGQGGTAAYGGQLVGAYGLGILVVAPLAGRLADRIGRVRLMRASLLASSLLLLIFPMLPMGSAALAGSFVLAVCTEAYRPASLAVITALAPEDQRRPGSILPVNSSIIIISPCFTT